MESFRNYVSEKKEVKNYVIKKDVEGNYQLMDSEGKEIKKARKAKELKDYAKDKNMTVVFFNEDNNS